VPCERQSRTDLAGITRLAINLLRQLASGAPHSSPSSCTSIEWMSHMATGRSPKTGERLAGRPKQHPGAGNVLRVAPGRPDGPAQRPHARCRPPRASAWWRARSIRERHYADPGRHSRHLRAGRFELVSDHPRGARHRATKLYSGVRENPSMMQSHACISDRPPATSMSR
jgi:hypothetical protein